MPGSAGESVILPPHFVGWASIEEACRADDTRLAAWCRILAEEHTVGLLPPEMDPPTAAEPILLAIGNAVFDLLTQDQRHTLDRLDALEGLDESGPSLRELGERAIAVTHLRRVLESERGLLGRSEVPGDDQAGDDLDQEHGEVARRIPLSARILGNLALWLFKRWQRALKRRQMATRHEREQTELARSIDEWREDTRANRTRDAETLLGLVTDFERACLRWAILSPTRGLGRAQQGDLLRLRPGWQPSGFQLVVDPHLLDRDLYGELPSPRDTSNHHLYRVLQRNGTTLHVARWAVFSRADGSFPPPAPFTPPPEPGERTRNGSVPV